jgi:hypothetical protein
MAFFILLEALFRLYIWRFKSETKCKAFMVLQCTGFAYLRRGIRNMLHCPYVIGQGGPTFFFPRDKNSFTVGPKGPEKPPDTIFEN